MRGGCCREGEENTGAFGWVIEVAVGTKVGRGESKVRLARQCDVIEKNELNP